MSAKIFPLIPGRARVFVLCCRSLCHPLSNSVFIVFCCLVAGVFVGLSFFAGIQDIFNMVLTPRFIEMLVLVAPPD